MVRYDDVVCNVVRSEPFELPPRDEIGQICGIYISDAYVPSRTSRFNRPLAGKQLSGAAEARRAHNPEGNGSKPFSAISFASPS